MNRPFEWRDAPAADFAVIGSDVSHSLSPVMHNAGFAACRLPYRYVAVNVEPGRVQSALDHLASAGYRGINVTFPIKAEAVLWVKHIDDSVALAGSVVNTIRMQDATGFNTDAAGFEQSLPWAQFGLRNRCLVLGAGGAARAILAVLERHGFSVLLWNRTRDKAESLAAGHSQVQVVEHPRAQGCSLVINATSASKYGEALDIDWNGTRPGAVAYDLYYAKDPSPFLTRAAEEGVATKDGTDMLVYQGAESWKAWQIDVEPPFEAMRQEVLARLGKTF